MKKIYIVLTHSGTTLSKIIKGFTKDEFSHVSISLDKELNEMYSFGRLNPYNPFWGGFVHEYIDTVLPELIRPENFKEITGLKEIYSGQLRNYHLQKINIIKPQTNNLIMKLNFEYSLNKIEQYNNIILVQF